MAGQLAVEWARIRRERVIFEDEAVVVLDKPVGIAVMGERHDTDLVTLAAEAGERLFPAHRIDKVTSGVVLFAKELRFHGDLTRQFNQRSVAKRYLVLTRTSGLPEHGTIDLPLSVGRKSRVRVAANRDSILADTQHGRWSVPPAKIFDAVRTYPSVTTFRRLWEDGEHTLLAAEPVTGRRHQIRVHLAWIGHPIEGDPLFEKHPTTRTFLHSWRLGFDAAWAGGSRRVVEAPPGEDFWAPVRERLPSDDATAVLAPARQPHRHATGESYIQ